MSRSNAARGSVLLAAFAMLPVVPAFALDDDVTLTDLGQGIFGAGPGVGGASVAGVDLSSSLSISAGNSTLGFSGSVSAAGDAHVSASSGISAGTADIVLPFASTLSASSNYLSGGSFTLTASGGLSAGSAAPIFAVRDLGLQAGLSADATLAASAKLSGCIASSCSSASASLVAGSGSVSLVGLDTTKSAPLTVLGSSVPSALFSYNKPVGYLGPIGAFTAYSPASSSGGAVTSATSTSFTASQKVLTASFDVGSNVGLPSSASGVSIGPVSASFTPLSVQPFATVNAAAGLTVKAPLDETLTFSQPVTQTVGGKAITGTAVTLGVSDPGRPDAATLQWAGSPGRLLSRTFSVAGGSLTTQVTTPVTFGAAVSVLQGSFSISAAGVTKSEHVCVLCTAVTKTDAPVAGTVASSIGFTSQTDAFGQTAQAVLSRDDVKLAARVGDRAPTQAIGLSNTAVGGDGLGYSAVAGGAPLTLTGSGSLSGGATKSDALVATLATSRAGSFTAPGRVQLTTDGSASGLGASALPSIAAALSGDVYAPAVAEVRSRVDFGIVHVGDRVSPVAVGVTNKAAGALTDQLDSRWAGGPRGFILSGDVRNLSQGASGALGADIDTSRAGVFAGQGAVASVSHDAELASLGLANAAVTLSGQVNNYAAAAFRDPAKGALSGGGGAYVLNLGDIRSGAAIADDLDVANIAAGPADNLGGRFVLGAAATTGALTLPETGFADVVAGGETPFSFDLSALTAGMFSEDITLDAYGFNASGYRGSIPTVTLTVEAEVDAPEPASLGLMGAALLTLAAVLEGRRRGGAGPDRLAPPRPC